MKIKASGRATLVAVAVVSSGIAAANAAPETSTETSKASAASPVPKASRATEAVKKARTPAKPQKSAKKQFRPAKATALPAPDVAADDGVEPLASSDALPLDLPPHVANANAQLVGGGEAARSTVFPDPAAAMAAPPEVTQPAAAPPASADIVAADQVNDIDRAEAQPKPQPQQSVEAKPATGSAAQVGRDDSTWGQTSLIGKIFIAFGGLLTLASAARMFIA